MKALVDAAPRRGASGREWSEAASSDWYSNLKPTDGDYRVFTDLVNVHDAKNNMPDYLKDAYTRVVGGPLGVQSPRSEAILRQLIARVPSIWIKLLRDQSTAVRRFSTDLLNRAAITDGLVIWSDSYAASYAFYAGLLKRYVDEARALVAVVPEGAELYNISNPTPEARSIWLSAVAYNMLHHTFKAMASASNEGDDPDGIISSGSNGCKIFFARIARKYRLLGSRGRLQTWEKMKSRLSKDGYPVLAEIINDALIHVRDRVDMVASDLGLARGEYSNISITDIQEMTEDEFNRTSISFENYNRPELAVWETLDVEALVEESAIPMIRRRIRDPRRVRRRIVVTRSSSSRVDHEVARTAIPGRTEVEDIVSVYTRSSGGSSIIDHTSTRADGITSPISMLSSSASTLNRDRVESVVEEDNSSSHSIRTPTMRVRLPSPPPLAPTGLRPGTTTTEVVRPVVRPPRRGRANRAGGTAHPESVIKEDEVSV